MQNETTSAHLVPLSMASFLGGGNGLVVSLPRPFKIVAQYFS